jgi:hypothetical protein
LKIFWRIFQKYLKNIAPKEITKVVKKQAGVVHVILFTTIFCYDFISIFFVGIQYMILDGKTNMDWKKLQQKL